VYKLFIALTAVFMVCCIFGCENELQKRQRQAIEEEARLNQDFMDSLNRIKDEARSADVNDGKSILRIVRKLEELQQEVTGVDLNLQDEFKNTLKRWNENYLCLARDTYNKAVRAANAKVDIQEYDAAIAEMNKFPEELRERGFYGDKVDKFVSDIKAFQDAPAEAHATLAQAEEFIAGGDYDKALEVCDSFFKNSGKVKGASIRIVINKHISILDRILDTMIDEGKFDEALDRMQYYMNVYGRGSDAHRSFLNEKAEYVDEKKAAAGK